IGLQFFEDAPVEAVERLGHGWYQTAIILLNIVDYGQCEQGNSKGRGINCAGLYHRDRPWPHALPRWSLPR
ncbi:MAG TPA: hypothetical protein VG011_05570, partial [Steroidobacteraceae bacterium]|nr:hypothetical protein [Steroidobacteraceae bacterium]